MLTHPIFIYCLKEMASANTTAFLLEKVSCPECKDTLTNPRRLQCEHSVCLRCLVEIQRKKSGSYDVIVCPRCQQKSRLESGNLNDLPISPYIASLCEVLRIVKSATARMKCCICNKEPTSLKPDIHTSYCFQCRGFWCDPCLTKHDAHTNSKHNILSIEELHVDVNKASEDVLKPRVYCQEPHHEGEELKFFCTSCSTAICYLCSHTNHEHHEKVVLQKAAVEFKTQIEDLVDEQLQQSIKKIEEIARLDEECGEVDRQAEEVKGEVNDFFRIISERLEAEKKKTLAEAEYVATRTVEALKRRKRVIQNQVEVISSSMNTASELLKHSTSVDVINLKKAFDEIVTKVKDEEEAYYDPERKPLQMSFVRTQELLDIIGKKGIGPLQTKSETSAEQSIVDSKGISKATVGIEARFRLTTRDAEGNPYRNKTDRVTVQVRNEKGQDCATGVRIQDDEDGSYKISYFAKEGGVLQASVKVNGDPVCGSPFAVEVKTREFRPIKSFGRTDGQNMERWGLAVSDNDEIAVTQSRRNIVQLFNINDTDSVLPFTKPGPMDGTFDSPTGIVFDKEGRILVSDMINGEVHIFSRNSDYVGKFAEKGELDHQLKCPHGLSIDQEGRVIIADTDNKLIKIFSTEGKFLQKIGVRPGEKGSFKSPFHCVQSGNYLLVSDTFAHDAAIKVFDREGAFLYQFGEKGTGEGQLNLPRCLGVDKLGHLLVCDTGNKRVQVFEVNDSNADFKGIFGTSAGKEDENIEPFSVGVLSDGRIVVNDVGHGHIQIVE